jgi:prepilin-type N-terminal cleavage/methylation domain-containing protein
MKRKAFTLIELIIVIVVLGILATIAIVGYRAVIDRANQSSAENAAKSFDRQIRAQAAFGMGDNPNMTDPNRGQLLIDMLRTQGAANTDPETVVKDIPDADVATASLTTNSLRALVWNGTGWTRLCTTPLCYPVSGAAIGTSAGQVPAGMTSATTTPVRLCFAFRKGGQTVYLGLSDRANTPGTVSSTLATACASSTNAPVAVANGIYTRIGMAPALTAGQDASW